MHPDLQGREQDPQVSSVTTMEGSDSNDVAVLGHSESEEEREDQRSHSPLLCFGTQI